MTITINENQRIAARSRRLPFPERRFVDEQVKQWIKDRIVEPCSSEYTNQIVIKKRNETPRVCVDYRALMVKDRFPFSIIEDILNRLQNARVFSFINLKNFSTYPYTKKVKNIYRLWRIMASTNSWKCHSTYAIHRQYSRDL